MLCNLKNRALVNISGSDAEEFLQNHFPDVATLRIDSDSTRKKETLNEYFHEVRKGKPMILLGTQLLAKGHHFPDVTLVGIIDADSGLFSADFRGSERVAQLMTQVSGRAGRSKKQGKVMIQTYNPYHQILQQVSITDYTTMYKEQMQELTETAVGIMHIQVASRYHFHVFPRLMKYFSKMLISINDNII